jgi:hypothetical protein
MQERGSRVPASDRAEKSRGAERSLPGARERSAQDNTPGPDRGAGEGRKSRAAESDKGSQDSRKSSDKSAGKSQRDDKPDKSAQSKDDSKPSKDGSKSAERDKSKSDDKGRDTAAGKDSPDKAASGKDSSDSASGKSSSDSASGASTGEGGSSAPGKLTEDRKKNDDVKKVQVTGEKRDRVQAGFKGDRDVKHETKVDVDIVVGRRVPRSWYFAPVPVAVIEVVPEYRGYVFAYVEDDYVICDPDTYEVVALVPATGSGGGTYAGGGGGSTAVARCSSDLTLSKADREDIIRSIEMTNEVSIGGVSIGFSVPQDIELQAFPAPVVERDPQLEACRYFIVDDQIAIVDPDNDKVVLMIENE